MRLFMLILGIIFGSGAVHFVRFAWADTAKAEKCDYTYVKGLDIGRDGEIKYGDDWAKVVNSGWKLKTIMNAAAIFEKCSLK